MKTFVGRIVTVSDGAGRSVTVSNWGVAQSSRHRTVHDTGSQLRMWHRLFNCTQHRSSMYVAQVDHLYMAQVIYCMWYKLVNCIHGTGSQLYVAQVDQLYTS